MRDFLLGAQMRGISLELQGWFLGFEVRYKNQIPDPDSVIWQRGIKLVPARISHRGRYFENRDRFI